MTFATEAAEVEGALDEQEVIELCENLLCEEFGSRHSFVWDETIAADATLEGLKEYF